MDEKFKNSAIYLFDIVGKSNKSISVKVNKIMNGEYKRTPSFSVNNSANKTSNINIYQSPTNSNSNYTKELNPPNSQSSLRDFNNSISPIKPGESYKSMLNDLYSKFLHSKLYINYLSKVDLNKIKSTISVSINNFKKSFSNNDNTQPNEKSNSYDSELYEIKSFIFRKEIILLCIGVLIFLAIGSFYITSR